MSLNILFAGAPGKFADYGPHLTHALRHAGLDAHVSRDIAPEEVDYMVYEPTGQVSDFTPFTRLRAVLSLWAGVEDIVANTTLTQPLARMADTGLREGMVEWVTAHVLRHHLGIDTHIRGQDGQWRAGVIPPLARHRSVSILGTGALGAACGQALSRLGFDVAGWSRRPKSDLGFASLSGAEGLKKALARAEILVLLLPLTAKTTHLITTETLALMPSGAFVINPGRGPLIDDDALLAALDAGQIAHATLDVFATEPLPPDHPYWAHPRVTVTPHIASATRPDTAAEFVARNIARVEKGLPLLAQVDPAEKY